MSLVTCRQILFASAAAIGLLAFSLYDPVPEYVQDRALLALYSAVLKAYTYLGRLMERLNMGSFETTAHLTSDFVFPASENSSSVVYYYRQFGGIDTLVATPAATTGSGFAAVVYIHGGGWAFGAPEMYNDMFEEIVKQTGIIVLALRYRLSNEKKFPAAFEDCLSAIEAIFNDAQSLGLDSSRIAIAGDSAGGQLAASVVQQLSRSGSPHRPKLHLMVYPVTQVANVHTDSYESQSDAALMKHLLLPRFLSLYLTGSLLAAEWISQHGHVNDAVRLAYETATGEPMPEFPNPTAATTHGVTDPVAKQVSILATDFRVSPLLATDLDQLQLPPAYILVCEYDRLLDDGVMYAKRLQRAGVRTHLFRFQTYHGSMDMPNDGREIRERLINIFKENL